ncbi:MAG: SDR family oxidoreductase [Cenarchaeum sp. SB0661_bin_35]|nr:SDR family oxidoreductase [Cenarchaeum sp. SB0667_bin_13]MXZ94092.1 SDR family oxidoreductase [Cenarchaeum sp. SB0666_bin_15]MYB46767.1 SDR family oxidoreductase [Cenarchaeum sp. SB0662_bin_33]MYC80100.1 SDR family oxidoreductase [Cenarchaeum sp. SB0661_bin_35]MYG32454.1 SDR family oxidoreductase [Cenarchaeum sp. SB0677_bin_16]MYI51720.1 SDR family oxidoreductase [Cenarchaeum sp. SB0673_bin_9]MYJ27204.1 SDR family oxidoreductase [Cenarchaeum sp. SB0672_bin_9]
MRDKVCLVTGASSDIGEGVVRRFVEEGAIVILLSRNLTAMEAVRKRVGSMGRTVSMVCDITNNSQVLHTVDRIIAEYGKIDVLVNNAGIITAPTHFHQMLQSEIDNIIKINLQGMFSVTKAVLRSMTDLSHGSIVNIGSTSSERAIPKVHLAVYSSTKAAMSMFTKSIAVEYARRNIRCNCVNPGIINSGMIKPYLDDPEARKVLESRLPMGRIGEPRDVANAVLFFASEESSWITGTTLNVDGGRSASEG